MALRLCALRVRARRGASVRARRGASVRARRGTSVRVGPAIHGPSCKRLPSSTGVRAPFRCRNPVGKEPSVSLPGSVPASVSRFRPMTSRPTADQCEPLHLRPVAALPGQPRPAPGRPAVAQRQLPVQACHAQPARRHRAGRDAAGGARPALRPRGGLCREPGDPPGCISGRASWPAPTPAPPSPRCCSSTRPLPGRGKSFVMPWGCGDALQRGPGGGTWRAD